VFIGPHTNYSRPLFREVRDPRVINLGAVDGETKTSALAACTFLCLPSICEAMGNAGWRKVQEKYTWEILASKTMAVYHDLLR